MPKSTKRKSRKNAANLDINREKLDATLKKQWILKAIELMREGYSTSYIREHIRINKEGSKTDAALTSILQEANAQIISSQFNKAEEIIPIHVSRYNRIAKDLLATQDFDDLIEAGEDPDPDRYWALREKKERAYSDCINTIKQKEELLQFHNKDFVIEMNTEETVEVRDAKPEIDIGELSFEEQVELYEFFKKAKKTDMELAAIVQNTSSVQQEVTEDVQHEVVEPLNIDFIKQEVLPVVEQKAKITASDPTVRLRESLHKLAAQRFKDAGGTLTDEEEKLIK
jgi:hypothetical protein